MTTTYKDRVNGMFLGVAIGDALGMPVETFSAEKIKETYGRVTEYHRPDNHKWFDGEEAGTTTDDTQLTIAVAEGLIEGGLDIVIHARKHVEAFHAGTHGWGRATKESIRNMANGVSWDVASLRKGVGNGVAMKIAPLGAYFCRMKSEEEYKNVFDFAFNISLMTHGTNIAAASGLVQTMGVWSQFCNDTPEETLNTLIVSASKIDDRILYDPTADDLSTRFKELKLLLKERPSGPSDEEIIESFDEGTCYCYNSLPFAYAFFLRNPDGIEALYDVVSAGGDTDTNGAIVGALLGARHGASIFPAHLIDGMQKKDQILGLAERFYAAVPISE